MREVPGLPAATGVVGRDERLARLSAISPVTTRASACPLTDWQNLHRSDSVE